MDRRGGACASTEKTATVGQTPTRKPDTICVDGVPLTPAGQEVYLMLNKPRSYVARSATSRDGPQRRNWWRTAGRAFISQAAGISTAGDCCFYATTGAWMQHPAKP